ncbi:MAG: hypothetical protein NXI20_00630 [bacterium]|nr:hypothetical protein [bacterium]
MRTIITTLLFLSSSIVATSQSIDQLKYTFRLSEKFDGIYVEVEYEPTQKTDSIKLLIPSTYDRFLMKNTVTIEGLKVENPSTVTAKSQSEYLLFTKGKTVNFSYFIPSFSNDTTCLPCRGDEYFIPAINQKFFHIYGDKGLVIPTYLNNENPLFQVTISWENFPEHWHIANDFGVSNETTKGREYQSEESISALNLGSSLFIGGEYRKTLTRIDDKELSIFLYGKWKFDDQLLISSIEDIAKAEFEHWDHFYHSKDYVISVTQKGTDDCGRMTGRNMFDSFCYYLPGKFAEDHMEFFYPSLVHEFTHSWIGVDLVANHPEPATMKWFVEGFTEYYTSIISRKTGFFNDQDYLRSLNKSIQSYLLSPFATISLEDYNDGYLYDERLENLAYNKGAIFAFYLDGYIREKTNDKHNLNYYLKVVFGQKSNSEINGNLTFRHLNRVAKQSLNLDFSHLFEKYIVQGELIPIESPLIGETEQLQYLSFDYCFNYVKSIETEIITNVQNASPAYEAGLRNGQKFLGINKMTSEPTGKMVFVVSDKEGKKTIEYSPKGKTISVPIIKSLKSID